MSSENVRESSAQTGAIATVGGIVGGILGVIVGGVIMYQIYNSNGDQDKYRMKGNHDEPIIIEDGISTEDGGVRAVEYPTVKVDFDRNNDTQVDPGEFDNGDRTQIFRQGADTAVRLRLWVNNSEKTCGNDCKWKLWGTSLSINTSVLPISFHWFPASTPPKHGLRLVSRNQNFIRSKSEYLGKFEPEQKSTKIESIEFKTGPNTKHTIDLRTNPNDIAAIQICFVDDDHHCPAYTALK